MRHLYNTKTILRTLLTGLILVTFFSANAQIKIGTNGSIISPASLLELESANQGLLLPRLADTAAINALSPPNGMLIYLTKAPAVGLYVRKATGWEYITGSLAGNGNFNSLTVANTVTAGTFSGPLNGNATSANTATTATNATNTTIVNDPSLVNPVFPTFVTQSPGNTGLKTATGKLSFVPQTGVLTAVGFTGNLVGNVTGNALSADDATNASNIRINDDNSNAATMYPVWVSGVTGNFPAKVTSNKLSFTPATGVLLAPVFKGALDGNAFSATNVSGVVNTVNGGTSFSSYTPGDILFAKASNQLERLSALGNQGKVLGISSVTGWPEWQQTGAGTVQSVTSNNTSRIVISNNDPTVAPKIDISPTYVGQTSITTVGTLTQGSLGANFTAVAVPQGGTGLSTLPPNVLVGDGTNSVTIPAGAANVGYVLTSTGLTSAPIYKEAAAGDMLKDIAQEVKGNKTFYDGTLILRGSSAGLTTLKAAASANGTTQIPGGNSILATTDLDETFTGKKTFNNVGGTSFTTPISFTTGSGTSLSLSTSVTAPTFIGSLSGNASTSTNTSNVGIYTASVVDAGVKLANDAVSGNTPLALVQRDGSGNFAASIITATLNGNAANVDGIVQLNHGGTGVNAATKTAAFNGITPMTAAGDLIYGGGGGNAAILTAQTSNTFLRGGTTPSWTTINLAAATPEVTGILPSTNGGTGANNGSATLILTTGAASPAIGSVKIISVNATVNFPNTSAGGYNDIDTPVTGAVDGDAVSLGVPNSAIAPGGIFTAWVIGGGGFVRIRFANTTGGALTPGPVDFKIKVIQ